MLKNYFRLNERRRGRERTARRSVTHVNGFLSRPKDTITRRGGKIGIVASVIELPFEIDVRQKGWRIETNERKEVDVSNKFPSLICRRVIYAFT